MKPKSIAAEKSYSFALEVVALNKALISKREYAIANQVLRSGTSIAANIREGIVAQSRRDFIHKMSISLKEAHETDFWIDLLSDSELIDRELGVQLKTQCTELIRILTATIKTTKANDNEPR